MDIQTNRMKRDAIVARISRIQGFIQNSLGNIASVKIQHVKVRKRHLEESWIELNETQNQIEFACKEEDLVAETDRRQHDEELQFDIESQIEDLLDLLTRTAPDMQSSSHATNRGSSNTQVKLPTINMPKFSGSYQEWTSYYDLFVSLVHNNQELTPVQKLFYLKSSLDGDAKKLLNSFSSTNANYEEAWKVLIKRYQNHRVIVNAHISALFNLRPIQGDTAASLRKLLDTTIENVRALTVLGEATDHWDSILIHMTTSRLDAETRQQWELSLKDTEVPKFSELQELLELKCHALEASAGLRTNKPSTKPFQASRQTTIHHAALSSCEICKLDHLPHKCPEFQKATMDEKLIIVKSKSLCFNCLRAGHQTKNCRSSSCRKCNKRHHTLLHLESNPTPAIQPAETQITTHCAKGATAESYVLLSTALILVKDKIGQYRECRALLDSGSQASFVTEDCVQRLQLPRQNTTIQLKAVGQLPSATPRGAAMLDFTGLNKEQHHTTKALILQKITGILPQCNISKTPWTHLEGLNLADPAFGQPGKIDILLGADIHADLIVCGKVKGKPDTPTAQQTTLGWVLSGNIATIPSYQTMTHHIETDISAQLQLFWEIEELPMEQLMTPLEQHCEEHFKATHTRDATGRFTVHLPFNPNVTQQLGDSKTKAIYRLSSIEARLKRNEETYNTYRDFMEEYIQLGHMSKVNNQSSQNLTPYYIPHHAVIRECSSTTKLRVVFDASSKSTTGISLNDKLLVGPTVQDTMMAIVLRFRIYPYVFTADIAKMFRQVQVHKDDRHYQRILWRESPVETITEFQLNTVTYGTASGTYLATKALQQLAVDGEAHFPLGSKVVNSDFYVDDLMSGSMTIEKAIKTQKEVIELCAGGGFELRKWTANNQALLNHLPAALCTTEESLALEFGTAVKTLGLQWLPHQDVFTFSVQQKIPTEATKRAVLSSMAQLFDPLGWLSPIIIRPKLLIQKLWLLGVGWDDPLPTDVTKEWKNLLQEFPNIQEIKIPRHIGIADWLDHIELHGFCDSSEAAYAAVAYIRRTSPSGHVTTSMLSSKTRVAPLKQLSLPRLELCGAYLLARLIKSVVEQTKLSFAHIHAWTDSSIVLAWLAAPPRKWTTFVANRVALIQGLVPPGNWSHVRSEDNPADCASRGLTVQQLTKFPLWWNGPAWLCGDSARWEPNQRNEPINTLIELHPTKGTVAAVFSIEALPIIDKYSSFSKLIRVTAYCIRFIRNCKLPRTGRDMQAISTIELTNATQYWIKFIQQQEFSPDISQLKKKKPLHTGSRLLALNPFLDQSEILRVGGRLSQSTLSYGQKHPILLPHKSNLTLLIVTCEHERYLHAGPQLLLSILRHRYWILGGRNLVRAVVQRCVTCHRLRAQTSHQLMGDLPSYRIQPGRAFERVGVDFGGPISVRASRLRGSQAQRTYKAYIALFVCMVTKAIHLELVTGLSTEAFLATLQRFIARRGRPTNIYSDCGTNFKGADAELQRLYNTAKMDNTVDRYVGNEGIAWTFIPPGSPHFGGLWEAGIKSTKAHLSTVIGVSTLTFEQLYTLLVQVEGCLNSRPLCPLSSDPSELEAITPGHFLIGQALTKPPEPDFTSNPMNRLTQWRQIQRMQQTFWKRWSTEYLSRLQQRPKWTTYQPNLQTGQLVLLKERGLPPLKWSLARILETHAGPDGLVRVVTLKTGSGTFKRAITNVSPLPFEN